MNVPAQTALVSIVIPVYNGSNYLGEAIDSALAQTYPNIEVVVINDGSTDDGRTEKVALSYGDRIRYYKKENGGVASALSYGVEKMAGDFFSWLSHDDLYVPEKISRQMQALAQAAGPRTVIYSNYEVFTDDPDTAVRVTLRGVPPEAFRYWLTIENRLHGCALLIPKQAFAECGKFDAALRTTQDYDLWFRMAEKFSFVHIPDILVKARSHAEQDSLKMGAVVLGECNALLSGFALRLGEGELKQASGEPLPLAYARIASSMWWRGFSQAAMTASRLALAKLAGEPLPTQLRVGASLVLGPLKYCVQPLRRLLPARVRGLVRRLLRGARLRAPPAEAVRDLALKEKFSEVYDKNIFGGAKSRSGEGSDMVQTAVIRREIPRLLQSLDVKTFLDAPCGDWYWMRHVDLPVDRYIGVDIVEPMIARNQREFGTGKTSFQCLNLASSELPKVDLIFSRDCLVHLSFDDARKIIANFKRSGATYLLTTTFTQRKANQDLGSGFWRPLNKQLPPFNFPPPQLLINEGCTEGNNMFTDKCLGLWRLEDIDLK
ncbi:glycosyltransferase [Polaromonas sp. YR568]|uniref:glycosyltransferase n=1 Tax=Polaromonas sp. YR568 TaxID=1855301 RepID=UPI00398C00BA